MGIAGSTPRDLAWDLRRSVFGTTAEVYKLLVRRLLSVDGDPAHSHDDAPGEVTGPGLAVMSFVRAVSVEKGETVPIFNAEVASGGAR